MSERVRSMMKRSASSRSVAHIGTTPCKYMVEFVISHVDGIKTADEVCLVWERRGKTIQTQVAKVTNQNATFRETLSMETTLFRRIQPNSKITAGEAPKPGEVLLFDEKKAKFSLRKGAPNGKALGKIALNLADYIKSLEDTKFVDLKLSNGSKVSVKINSKFLHVGKKKKDGEGADGGGSDNESVMSDMNAPDDDNDSIFGEDADSQISMEIEVEREMSSHGGSKVRVPVKRKTPPVKGGGSISAVFSPVSSDGKGSPFAEKTGSRVSKRMGSIKLKESPSTRSSRGRKKEKEKEKEEFQKVIAQLKEENKKLKSSKKAAVEEIDALRDELTSIEELKDNGNKSPKSQETSARKSAEEMKSLRKQIKELRNQNANLVEELEEIHKEQGGSEDVTRKLRDEIADLKVALEREPKFMDVVNELKVQKVSLALANMEREQAEFALKQYKAGLLKTIRSDCELLPLVFRTAFLLLYLVNFVLYLSYFPKIKAIQRCILNLEKGSCSFAMPHHANSMPAPYIYRKAILPFSAKTMDDPPSSESEVGSPVVLPRLRSDTTFSDCILEVDGEEIPAHRAVLASVSPFFEAAFGGTFKEAREQKISLKETTANAVHRLLDFVYGVETERCIEDAVLALEAWELARRFEINGLQKICAGLAVSQMNAGNAIDVYQKSVQFGCCGDILTKAFLYVVHNFEDIVKESSEESKYHELSYSEFIDVLQSSELVCSESTRIKAIENWIRPESSDADDQDVRCIYAEALLSEIRFELLEDHELAALFYDNAEWIPRNNLVYALTHRPNRGTSYSRTVTRTSCENCGSLNLRTRRNRCRHSIVTVILPLPPTDDFLGNKFSMMSKKMYFKINHWVFSVRAHASDDETVWFHIVCERMLSIPKHYTDQMSDLLQYRFHIAAEITSFKRPLWTSEALFSPVGMCICTNAPLSALTVACCAQITITAHKKYEVEI